MGGTTQEDNKNNEDNKMINKKRTRIMKTTNILDFNRGKKMYKSIGYTRYVNETKMYAKNNQ